MVKENKECFWELIELIKENPDVFANNSTQEVIIELSFKGGLVTYPGFSTSDNSSHMVTLLTKLYISRGRGNSWLLRFLVMEDMKNITNAKL